MGIKAMTLGEDVRHVREKSEPLSENIEGRDYPLTMKSCDFCGENTSSVPWEV